MMTRFFIVHGAYGNPEENWIPWLKKELEKIGHEVNVPKFPTPDDQTLDNWLQVFKPYNKLIDQDTIFIGHSLGPTFILNILQRINTKIKAAFLISAVSDMLGNKQFDKINHTFFEKGFNWKKIKKNCGTFVLINSTNDPYIPMELGKRLAQNLDISLILLKDAGHINKAAGFIEFNFLLEKIKEVL